MKLERTMGWRGFGLEEGMLGRAKEKQSGFSTIPSFISRYKLHGMNSVLAVLVFYNYRHNKLHLSVFLWILIIGGKKTSAYV